MTWLSSRNPMLDPEVVHTQGGVGLGVVLRLRGSGAFRPLRSPLWGEQVISYVGSADSANHGASRACRDPGSA
jgi:hypothetical protein